MAFIQVPTLIERKRYSDGMGGISTSPGRVPRAGRRGARKRSRSRLGSLSSGALGSLGDDDTFTPTPGADITGGAGTLTPPSNPLLDSGSGDGPFVGTPGSTPGLNVGPLTSPFTSSGQLTPSSSSSSSSSSSVWGVIGNLATAAGKIINPSAYATVYPYTTPTSPATTLLLIGGGVLVFALLLKKK